MLDEPLGRRRGDVGVDVRRASRRRRGGRHVGELLFPVGKLPSDLCFAIALFERAENVGEADGDGREERTLPVSKGAVEGFRLLPDPIERRRVRDQPMRGDDEDVLVLVDGDELGAKERTFSKVEKRQRFATQEVEEDAAPIVRGYVAQVAALDTVWDRGVDDLDDTAFTSFEERRPQGLVPLHDLCKDFVEGLHVERAANPRGRKQDGGRFLLRRVPELGLECRKRMVPTL